MKQSLLLFFAASLMILGCANEKLTDDNTSASVRKYDNYTPTVTPTVISQANQSYPNESAESAESAELLLYENTQCPENTGILLCTCMNGKWIDCIKPNPTITNSVLELEQTNTLLEQSTIALTKASNIYQPILSISPTISNSGSLLSVQGSGYPPNRSVLITYYYGSNSMNMATFIPNDSGIFSGGFAVPTNAHTANNNLIKASVEHLKEDGTIQNLSATATHYIPNNEISLSHTQGVAGSKITLTGTGFRSSSVITNLTIGGYSALANTHPNSDGQGNVNLEITVPGIPIGIHLVVINIANKVSTTYFEVASQNINEFNPVLTVDSPISKSDALLTIEGSNYPPNRDVLITYYYGARSINVGTFTPDSVGYFTGQFKMPLDASTKSNNLIKSSVSYPLPDGSIHKIISSAHHYMPEIYISTSVSTGIPGSLFELTGFGFAPSTVISNITLGGVPMKITQQPATDINGELTIDVEVPYLQPGTHLVLCTVAGKSANGFFNVISP
jgi:hypothetical protein